MYDCTAFGVNELSLIVFNDETLYNMRDRMNKPLLDFMNIKYTSEQYDILMQDIAEDCAE